MERAAAVASTGVYDKAAHVAQPAGDALLVDGPHFRVERVIGVPDAGARARFTEGLLAVPLGGSIGAGMHGSVGPGECVYSRSIDALDFSRAGISILAQ